MLSRWMVSSATVLPPWRPMCMQLLPRPEQVPGAGFVQVPGAGEVHLPSPWTEQSVLKSQRMFVFPEHAPRQLPTPVASQNSPGTLPPAHLPGQSRSPPQGPPGVPPPMQLPDAPESRPPSGGGLALTFECRCQSSGTAVPGSWRRKQPCGAERAPGLLGLLYWQCRPGWLETKLCAQSAFHAASVPYWLGSKEKLFVAVAGGGAAPFTSMSRSSVKFWGTAVPSIVTLEPSARMAVPDTVTVNWACRMSEIADRLTFATVNCSGSLLPLAELSLLARTLILPNFAVASLMHAMFGLCVVRRAATFSTSKSETLRSVRTTLTSSLVSANPSLSSPGLLSTIV